MVAWNYVAVLDYVADFEAPAAAVSDQIDTILLMRNEGEKRVAAYYANLQARGGVSTYTCAWVPKVVE